MFSHLNPTRSHTLVINAWFAELNLELLMVARGRFELPSMGLFLVRGVQSPSLAGSLFSTLASPLHHRATRDPGLRPSPNKPSPRSTNIDADESPSPCWHETNRRQCHPLIWLPTEFAS